MRQGVSKAAAARRTAVKPARITRAVRRKTAVRSRTIAAKPVIARSAIAKPEVTKPATAKPLAKPAAKPVLVKSAPVERKPGPWESYREMLVARRAELLANLGLRVDPFQDRSRASEEDQAQMSHEEFISLRRNSMDHETLRLVSAAIERIDTGEYGLCLNCEESISLRRLAALPWAEYCVACQDQVAHELSSGGFRLAYPAAEVSAKIVV